MFRSDRVRFTTDASGNATVYSRSFAGLIHAIVYDYVDGDTGADFTITDDATGMAILTVTNAGTADATYLPRGATASIANAAALYAAGGTGVFDRLPVVGRVKVVVAQGGNVKTGSLVIIWEE